MFEQLTLGAIQGITEWLPVSSESFVLLVKINFFGGDESVRELIKLALLFHLGTFLAALIYLRRDVAVLLKAIFNYKSASVEYQKILKFLIIVTVISGLVGFLILKLLSGIETKITGQVITLLIGILLLMTGWLGIRARIKNMPYRGPNSIKTTDGVLLGLVQGLAVLPGLSRSGLTVSTLLLRKFDDIYALKLSFLMSLPIVLAGNILLNLGDWSFSLVNLWGIAASFLFGILTIHFLLKIARRVNFNYFVIGFGVLVLISALV